MYGLILMKVWVLPEKKIDFSIWQWNAHPVFEGVKLKHIVTASETNVQFSYHLVEIAPNKKIGLHIHENQLETHEVIAGSGMCLNNGKELEYSVGGISIFPMGIEHEIVAGSEGLCLFAKFFPALC